MNIFVSFTLISQQNAYHIVTCAGYFTISICNQKENKQKQKQKQKQNKNKKQKKTKQKNKKTQNLHT